MTRTMAPKTVIRYRDVLKHEVNPIIGNIQLDKLRPVHIQNLLAKLREERPDLRRCDRRPFVLSDTSRRKVHRVLHSALAYAVRLQLIMTNPANGVTASRITTKEMAALTPEQARAVLRASAAEGIRWQAFFTAAITTGLRLGELLGLRWKDVDFDARLLRVCQIAQVVRGQGTLIKAPKTPAASRTIALGSHVVALLRKHRVEQDATRLAFGPEWHDLDLVFPNIFGRPMVDETLRKTFHRILERACPLSGSTTCGIPPLP